jgi:hypothetical protein
MGDKPMRGIYHIGRDRPVAKAAYFFLRGFAFFFVISSRVFTGIASIRRASSSRGITGESAAACCAGLCLLMVGV